MKNGRFIFTAAVGLLLSGSAMAQDVKQSKKAELKPSQTVQPAVEQKAPSAQPAKPLQRQPMGKTQVNKVALKRAAAKENPELENN
jgi:hypothetical protein